MSTQHLYNPSHVLSPHKACEFLGVSLSTLQRLRKAGAIVSPIRLSDRRIGWRISDLDAYVSAQQGERTMPGVRNISA